MGAYGKQPQPNNLPQLHGRSKVRKTLDTTDQRPPSRARSALAADEWTDVGLRLGDVMKFQNR